MAAASVARPSAVHGPALPTTMCSIPSAAAPAQRRTNSSLDSPNLLVTPSSPGRGGGILQRSDVDAGEQPAVRCAYGDERDPEPAKPLVPGQNETHRAHADETVGEDPAEEPGVVALLGRSPALRQVEDLGCVTVTAHWLDLPIRSSGRSRTGTRPAGVIGSRGSRPPVGSTDSAAAPMVPPETFLGGFCRRPGPGPCGHTIREGMSLRQSRSADRREGIAAEIDGYCPASSMITKPAGRVA